MTERTYLYAVTLDGPIYGIQTHDMLALKTDNPKDTSSLMELAHDMAYDHVTSYIDEEEYEEENGTELEVESVIEPYDPEEHVGWTVGSYDSFHESCGFKGKVAQDENGYWYSELFS